ncbi:MAG TPA: hypothetical protein VFD49_10210 [Candidatus Dormibacteraeota bacterium]|nr:hypothetical protein [Candidatus Dormibacteraeota bacterium]
MHILTSGNPLVEVVIVAVALVALIGRQLTARPLNERRLWLMPLAALAYGAYRLLQAPGPDAATLATLALEAAVLGGLGLARGASIRVWTSPEGVPMSRGTLLTLGLWAVAIAVRLGAALLQGGGGSAGVGELIFLVGVSFATQNAVIWARAQALPGVRAGERSFAEWRR